MKQLSTMFSRLLAARMRPARRRAAGQVLALMLAPALAQAALPGPVIPISDSSLDVPYVQTPDNVVQAMLDLGAITDKDFVIDLGSGDGRLLITAAVERGARGFGVDIDPNLVALANRRAQEAGVADRARFLEQDLFETDLSQATVIMMYLLPDVNIKLRPRLLATVQPGTRVVSHDYGFGDWEPDRTVTVDAPDKPVNKLKQSDLLLWIVPADVEGRWVQPGTRADDPVAASLQLQQQYQHLSGTLLLDGVALPIEQGRMNGRAISFTVAHAGSDYVFEGESQGDRLQGSLRPAKGGPARNLSFVRGS